MKNYINHIYLVLIVLLMLMAFLISCTPGDEPTPSERETFIGTLAQTWIINADNLVELEGQDITHAFVGFELTINDDLTYTTNSNELTITEFPWPAMGSFTLNTELNQLERDDGLVIDIELASSGDELLIEFDGDGTGSRKGVGGGWRCRFSIGS